MYITKIFKSNRKATKPREAIMSRKLILLVTTILLILNVIGCQKQIDIEAEKESIKKVLQAQLDAVKTQSYEGEAAVWAHSPYIVRKESVGWDSISVYYQKSFEENQKLKEKDTKNYFIKEFTASNFDIYVNGNFASAFHDEHMEYIWEGKEFINDGRPHKYLEKIDGEWKIITLF